MSDNQTPAESEKAQEPEMVGNLTREEFDKRRKGRNIAIAVSLGLFVLLIYLIGIFRLGPAILERPM